MKRQQVVNCMFSNWYHHFKSVTFKSEIISLPPDFVLYLSSDGIVLPDEENVKYSNRLQTYSDDSDDDGCWDSETTARVSMFPELKVQVESAIDRLGGQVFPKLNWSSPQDAAWISHNQSLKCSTFNEICLLLKSSDFVSHDLHHAYDRCSHDDPSQQHEPQIYELVLREWKEIAPGMEFRCFVKHSKLIRITQRHVTFFNYLHEKKQSIYALLCQFFNRIIKEKFADVDFVFDVYIDENNRVYLIDFNPFGVGTDSGLVSWDELHDIDPNDVDLNNDGLLMLVHKDVPMQPSHLVTHGMPKDMMDLCRGEDVNKMIDFLNLKDMVYRPTDSDDDDEDIGAT